MRDGKEVEVEVEKQNDCCNGLVEVSQVLVFRHLTSVHREASGGQRGVGKWRVKLIIEQRLLR